MDIIIHADGSSEIVSDDETQVLRLAPWHPELQQPWTGEDDRLAYARAMIGKAHAWQPNVEPEPTFRKLVTRVEFKLLFTGAERIAIKIARAHDMSSENLSNLSPAALLKLGLDDLFEILDDPQLETIDVSSAAVSAGLDVCANGGLITAERRDEIAAGIPEPA